MENGRKERRNGEINREEIDGVKIKLPKVVLVISC